jgi:hypothetical protein
MTSPGVFVDEKHGARVATIRDGDNAVEMKDNRDGTADLTIFWAGPSSAEDLTAFRLDRNALMALRRSIDGMLIQIAGSGSAENAG